MPTSLKIINEKQLLKRIAKGDSAAFAIVFDYYKDILYRFAVRLLKDDDMSKDLVQEVMLKLWQTGEKLIDINNLDSWLRVSCRNRAIDLLREQQARMKRENNLLSVSETADNVTEEAVFYKDTQSLLKVAIDYLPPKQREVYLLTENDGLDSVQVAKQLGLSKLTVQTHLKLARRKIRNYLYLYIDIILIVFFTYFK